MPRVPSCGRRRAHARATELEHELELCPSVPPGRPGPGVGVKKINVRPYSPPAKLKPAARHTADGYFRLSWCKKSKISVGSVAPPGTGYKQAVTSYTLGRARVPRGFRARGIFPKKSLSYAAGPLRYIV